MVCEDNLTCVVQLAFLYIVLPTLGCLILCCLLCYCLKKIKNGEQLQRRTEVGLSSVRPEAHVTNRWTITTSEHSQIHLGPNEWLSVLDFPPPYHIVMQQRGSNEADIGLQWQESNHEPPSYEEAVS